MWRLMTWVFVVLPLMAVPVLAQDYQPGHGALEAFDEAGRAAMPAWIRIWLAVMLATFALGLLFVWRRLEARWVVGGFALMMVAAITLTRAMGLAPLGGLFALLHVVFWSPALYLLLKRRPFAKERSLYAFWSGAITVVILVSFFFDIPDAAIYLHHMLTA